MLVHITTSRSHPSGCILYTPMQRDCFFFSNVDKVSCWRRQVRSIILTGIEPATLWSRVKSPIQYTTAPPRSTVTTKESTVYSQISQKCMFVFKYPTKIFPIFRRSRWDMNTIFSAVWLNHDNFLVFKFDIVWIFPSKVKSPQNTWMEICINTLQILHP